MCPFQSYFTEYQQKYILFFLFECFLFFLPVIPNNFYVRIFIISIYFISHRYHVQSMYASTKRELLDESLDNTHINIPVQDMSGNHHHNHHHHHHHQNAHVLLCETDSK
jgi:predicted membrane protein